MWLATHYSHFLQYDSITDAALMDSQTTTFHTCTVNLHVHVLYNTIQYNTIQYCNNEIQYSIQCNRVRTVFQKQISRTFLLTVFHTLHIFLAEFNRFPELSRTRGFFPGLSRSSRTSTNPVQYNTIAYQHSMCHGWSLIKSQIFNGKV